MIVHTYEYDISYIPAMPVVELVVGKASSAPVLSLKALVDSGSDGTIPLEHLKQIGVLKFQKTPMRTITGQRAQVDLYLISIQIGSFQRDKLAVAGDPQLNEADHQDVLNHLIVTLDGLATQSRSPIDQSSDRSKVTGSR